MSPTKAAASLQRWEIPIRTHKGRWYQGTSKQLWLKHSGWTLHSLDRKSVETLQAWLLSNVFTKVSQPQMSGLLPQSYDFLSLYWDMRESTKVVIIAQIKDIAICKGLHNQFLISKKLTRDRGKTSPQIFQKAPSSQWLQESSHAWGVTFVRSLMLFLDKDQGQSCHLLHSHTEHPVNTCFPLTRTGLMSNHGDNPSCRAISQAQDLGVTFPSWGFK